MKYRLLLLLLVLLFPILAFANVFKKECSLNYIAPKLPIIGDTTCKFTQDKFIPQSNLHLKSSGNFSFSKKDGVTFYTMYPIKTTVSYTTHEYRQINNIIKSIANKQFSRLEQDFKFYFIENGSTWDLGLKPKNNSKIQNYITSIEISGQKNISKIIITLTDKTKTTINFIK